MTVQVGDDLYRLSKGFPDALGVCWFVVEVRQVLHRDERLTILSSMTRGGFPEHSPPKAIEDTRWWVEDNVGGLVLKNAVIDERLEWSLSPPLPEPLVIDEAAALQVRAKHRASLAAAARWGTPPPELDQADALLMAILDWREFP